MQNPRKTHPRSPTTLTGQFRDFTTVRLFRCDHPQNRRSPVIATKVRPTQTHAKPTETHRNPPKTHPKPIPNPLETLAGVANPLHPRIAF